MGINSIHFNMQQQQKNENQSHEIRSLVAYVLNDVATSPLRVPSQSTMSLSLSSWFPHQMTQLKFLINQ